MSHVIPTVCAGAALLSREAPEDHYHSYHYQVRCAGNHGGVPSGSVRDVGPVHRRRYHPGHTVNIVSAWMSMYTADLRSMSPIVSIFHDPMIIDASQKSIFQYSENHVEFYKEC